MMGSADTFVAAALVVVVIVTVQSDLLHPGSGFQLWVWTVLSRRRRHTSDCSR